MTNENIWERYSGLYTTSELQEELDGRDCGKVYEITIVEEVVSITPEMVKLYMQKGRMNVGTMPADNLLWEKTDDI
jgi:hypothetical protein